MAINSDKRQRWPQDIAALIDLFNCWFMQVAPQTYRDSRVEATGNVEDGLRVTGDLLDLTVGTMKAHPRIIQVLRMACSPPLARDRLTGLAHVNKGLVNSMEKGTLPRLSPALLDESLARMVEIFRRLLDRDVLVWLQGGGPPTSEQRHRAATIIADRICGALADPIIRNAQEDRQLSLISAYLDQKGYRKKPHPMARPLQEMEPGTYSTRMNILVPHEDRTVKIPVDVAIQPRIPRPSRVPVLIEVKSAGDFTNTNKRRKEEATKTKQLTAAFGADAGLVLFLCGYFDKGYLEYEAREGIDWIWEHRITDLDQVGI